MKEFFLQEAQNLITFFFSCNDFLINAMNEPQNNKIKFVVLDFKNTSTFTAHDTPVLVLDLISVINV